MAEGEIDLDGDLRPADNPVQSFIRALLQATVDDGGNLEFDAHQGPAVESKLLFGRLYGQANLEDQGDKVQLAYRLHNADGTEVLTGVIAARF